MNANRVIVVAVYRDSVAIAVYASIKAMPSVWVSLVADRVGFGSLRFTLCFVASVCSVWLYLALIECMYI